MDEEFEVRLEGDAHHSKLFIESRASVSDQSLGWFQLRWGVTVVRPSPSP